MKIRILFFFFSILVFASCGEYNKILKSKDPEVKYTYAKKYFDAKKYSRTSTLLEDVVTYYTGSSKEEEILFLLAQSYFFGKDYTSASQYYNRYCNKFPNGEFTELAKYNSAYGLYLDSPDPRLDQSNTIKGIQEFQNYLELYPHGEKAADAQKYMFDLQEKLAMKQWYACKLYFNLGLYKGNNYEACIVTAHEAMKDFPFTKFAQDFQLFVVKSKYELANKSVEFKKPVRYRELLDECYNYKNMFPKGKYMKQIDDYYDKAIKVLGASDPSDLQNLEDSGDDQQPNISIQTLAKAKEIAAENNQSASKHKKKKSEKKSKKTDQKSAKHTSNKTEKK